MSVVRRGVRVTAIVMAMGVGGLAAAPAFAASEVGHGQANAVNIAIAGMGQSVSGTYAASNDGTKQTTSGTKSPALSVLGSQSLVSQGTLAQDATTSVAGKIVSSAACAGISGDGATLANVGSSDSCFANTKTLSLTSGALDGFANFDPTTDIIANGQFTAAFQQALTAIPGLGDVLKQLQAGGANSSTQIVNAIKQVLAAVGDPSLTFGATAIEGRCVATQGSASGSSTTAGLGLDVNFGSAAGIRIPLTDANGNEISDNPAPNTKVVTNLSAVTAAYTKALTAALTRAANDPSNPLAPLFAGLAQGTTQAAAINTIIAQITKNLTPVQDDLLDITLNKQSSSDDSQIHVTALDAQVLPAAAQVTGSSLLSIQLGDVDCLGGTVAPAATTSATPAPRAASNVPTDIDSGLAGDTGGLPNGVLAALGALFLVAAGGVGVRRMRLNHDKG